jgi:hypothetical protein
MIYTITCAYVGPKGRIELRSYSFKAGSPEEASEQAIKHYTNLKPDVKQFIYSAPFPAKF